MEDREMRVKNERRLDLIEKKYRGGGIDEAEEHELDRLKAEVGDYIARKFPRARGPVDLAAWFARTEAKIEAKKRLRETQPPSAALEHLGEALGPGFNLVPLDRL